MVSVAAPAAPAAATRGVYRIMPLGDSITKGVGQDGARYTGYRVRLDNHLRSGAVPAGFRYEWVGSQVSYGRHEGHGGWTVDQISARIDGWMDAYRPDIVLLHVGTNNITRGEPAAVVLRKVRDLVRKIRARSAYTQIFVARIVGVRADWATADERRRNVAVAHGLWSVAAGAGPRVYPVDMRQVTGLGLFDWHHPNRYGYHLMAYRWYEAMRGRVNGSRRWGDVLNPFTLRRVNVCQVSKVTRVASCAVRTVR